MEGCASHSPKQRNKNFLKQNFPSQLQFMFSRPRKKRLFSSLNKYVAEKFGRKDIAISSDYYLKLFLMDQLVIAFINVVAPKGAVCFEKGCAFHFMLVHHGFGGPTECPWA